MSRLQMNAKLFFKKVFSHLNSIKKLKKKKWKERTMNRGSRKMCAFCGYESYHMNHIWIKSSDSKPEYQWCSMQWTSLKRLLFCNIKKQFSKN